MTPEQTLKMWGISEKQYHNLEQELTLLIERQKRIQKQLGNFRQTWFHYRHYEYYDTPVFLEREPYIRGNPYHGINFAKKDRCFSRMDILLMPLNEKREDCWKRDKGGWN